MARISHGEQSSCRPNEPATRCSRGPLASQATGATGQLVSGPTAATAAARRPVATSGWAAGFHRACSAKSTGRASGAKRSAAQRLPSAGSQPHEALLPSRPNHALLTKPSGCRPAKGEPHGVCTHGLAGTIGGQICAIAAHAELLPLSAGAQPPCSPPSHVLCTAEVRHHSSRQLRSTPPATGAASTRLQSGSPLEAAAPKLQLAARRSMVEASATSHLACATAALADGTTSSSSPVST